MNLTPEKFEQLVFASYNEIKFVQAWRTISLCYVRTVRTVYLTRTFFSAEHLSFKTFASDAAFMFLVDWPSGSGCRSTPGLCTG